MQSGGAQEVIAGGASGLGVTVLAVDGLLVEVWGQWSWSISMLADTGRTGADLVTSILEAEKYKQEALELGHRKT